MEAHKVSTRTTVKQEALAELRKLMGNSDNGQAPISKKLRYADLRQMLIDSYVAQGNKSLKSLADGTETINGLTELDKFCGYTVTLVDGKPTVTDRGVAAIALTTDFAKKFVRQRRDEGTELGHQSFAVMLTPYVEPREACEKKIHHVPFIEFQKEPPPQCTGFVEQADFDRLFNCCPHICARWSRSSTTAARESGQALKTEWSQVDLKKRLIRFEGEDTKNDKRTSCPWAHGYAIC